MTVLVQGISEQALLQRLPDRLRTSLQVLDEYSMQTFPPQEISVSRIDSFKGLENEAIILVGLPQQPKHSNLTAESYVAMSRARSVLSIIYVEQCDAV